MARAFKGDLPPPPVARKIYTYFSDTAATNGDLSIDFPSNTIRGMYMFKKQPLNGTRLEVNGIPNGVVPWRVTMLIDNPPEFYRDTPGLKLTLDRERHRIQIPAGTAAPLAAEFGTVTYDTTTKKYRIDGIDGSIEFS